MNFSVSACRRFTHVVKIQYQKLNNKSYLTVLIFSYIDLCVTKYSFLKATISLFHVGHNPSTGFAENWECCWKLPGSSNWKVITYLLTPWSRVLLEKLTGSAASQEIPRIFGTRKFITVLTSARHLSLSWANSIQSLKPLPTSWRSILILSSHLRLGLPSGLFPSGHPTRTLCTPLPSPIRATEYFLLK